jgi:hypothetical protein
VTPHCVSIIAAASSNIQGAVHARYHESEGHNLIVESISILKYLCKIPSTTKEIFESVPDIKGIGKLVAMSVPDPLASIDMAFMKLKQSVDSIDAVNFQSTTLEDVWKAVFAIQQHQRERKSMRNMQRIEPFLQALEKYSKTIEVICNGTPYLPWIWVCLAMNSPNDNDPRALIKIIKT